MDLIEAGNLHSNDGRGCGGNGCDLAPQAGAVVPAMTDAAWKLARRVALGIDDGWRCSCSGNS